MKRLICDDCKKEKLKQIGIKMNVGIGYSTIGKCSICNKNNQELFAFCEEKQLKFAKKQLDETGGEEQCNTWEVKTDYLKSYYQ